MAEYDGLSQKYESAMKEKMLMKLEKDRLIAKVENLEIGLKQSKLDNDASLDKTLGLGQQLDRDSALMD